MILTEDYTRVATASDDIDWEDASWADMMRAEYPNKHSWWINPHAVIYDSGHDHHLLFIKNPWMLTEETGRETSAETNKKDALSLGWIRVGLIGNELAIQSRRDAITRAQILCCQEIYESVAGNSYSNPQYKIFISLPTKSGYISPQDFRWATYQSDLIKVMFRDPAGRR
jgi:hypothetical protein